MNIELVDGNLLKITWALYSPEIDAEIIRRLQSVPGVEISARRCYAPVIQCERLMQLFSRASFAYEALCAADKAARDFFDSLVGTGVKLVIDGDAVRAVGDNVSPLIAQLVNDRSPALMSFVLLEMERRQRAPQTIEPLQGPQTAEDAKWGVWHRGVQNAAKKVEREAQTQYGKRRRNRKPEQKGLGL